MKLALLTLILALPRRVLAAIAPAFDPRIWIVVLAFALPIRAQVEIRYSRQSDAVVKALVGTVPKDVSLYRADVVNLGDTEARMFPSRVGFEASATAPMQDPAAALFAAQRYKDTRWWVVSLGILKESAKYAGPAVLGLATGGVAVPAIVTGLAGGIGGSAVILDSYQKQAAQLTVPPTWLRDGLPEIILRPGEPVPYLIALGGKPPETFNAIVGQPKTVAMGCFNIPVAPVEWPNVHGVVSIERESQFPGVQSYIPGECIEGHNARNGSTLGTCPTNSICDVHPGTLQRVPWVAPTFGPSHTHPQIEDPEDTYAKRIAVLIREHSAQVGAGN